eukprot:TRINITY_DN4882_c0_g1_i1.p1 TRINITY_DN4882_c0_g1~~TRINITY_DN4882_c0_g1_i1.p1  ORF type:complete len:319 (-),score=88.16 TRINITY_DN4882_c0_g1_i1:372-1328(-)
MCIRDRYQRRVHGENQTGQQAENQKSQDNKENKLQRPQSSQTKSKASIQLPPPTDDLEQYIEILYDHQKNCEKQGKYVEAEITKRRLKELKIQLESSNKKEMKDRHFSERNEVEKAHLSEFNEFNQFWDQKMKEFEEEARKVEQQTIDKQNQEMNQFIEELEKSLPLKPKDSPELLNLKKIEESLAKQEDYIEAHKIQQRVLQIEKEEYEKWVFMRQQKIKNLIIQLKTRHNNELNALRQRIISGQEEQRKVRGQELEKLLQKYQNVKKELEITQNQEFSRMDKTFKTGSIMNVSKMLNQSRMSNASQMKQDMKANKN